MRIHYPRKKKTDKPLFRREAGGDCVRNRGEDQKKVQRYLVKGSFNARLGNFTGWARAGISGEYIDRTASHDDKLIKLRKKKEATISALSGPGKRELLVFLWSGGRDGKIWGVRKLPHYRR